MAMGGFMDLDEPNHEFSSSTEGDATKDSDEHSGAKVVKDATIDVGNNKGKGKMPMCCCESGENVATNNIESKGNGWEVTHSEFSNVNVNEVSNTPPLSTDGGNFKTLCSFDEVEVIPDPSFTPAGQHGDEEGNRVTEGNISLQDEENVVADAADDEESKRGRERESNLVMKYNKRPRRKIDQRVVVQLESRMDILDDGYRWHKYGRKNIKGSPYLRSYYRCSNNGCSARKQVQRDVNNSRCVKTTYDGRHNHGVPSNARIINPPIIKPKPQTIREEIEAANVMVTFAIPPGTTARLPRPTQTSPPPHPNHNTFLRRNLVENINYNHHGDGSSSSAYQMPHSYRGSNEGGLNPNNRYCNSNAPLQGGFGPSSMLPGFRPFNYIPPDQHGRVHNNGTGSVFPFRAKPAEGDHWNG
ncbi:WRKY domain [Sesbania bispinosa]|nr:WRKY domain [Sesbania bispinosa]